MRREMVYVYHALKNNRQAHMMGGENMSEGGIVQVGLSIRSLGPGVLGFSDMLPYSQL